MLLGELDPEAIGAAIEHATHYEPTPLADFDRFIKALPSGFDFGTATFIDIGSGMGRVVLLAAGYPFKQVVGIEVSPALHEVAKENLARYPAERRRCRDVRLVCADASQAPLPAGNLVAYLYNPFSASLVRRVANRLAERGTQHGVLALYHTPADPNAFEETAAFATVSVFDFGVLYRAI